MQTNTRRKLRTTVPADQHRDRGVLRGQILRRRRYTTVPQQYRRHARALRWVTLRIRYTTLLTSPLNDGLAKAMPELVTLIRECLGAAFQLLVRFELLDVVNMPLKPVVTADAETFASDWERLINVLGCVSERSMHY